MNKIVLTGNLGRSPELRKTQTGKSVVNFSIAVNDGFGDNKKTNWFRIVVWNKLAEICNQYLDKGSKVAVSGRLDKNEYEKDGVKKKSYEIIAQEVEFLNKVEKKDDGWDTKNLDTGGSQHTVTDNAGTESDDDLPF